MSSAQLEDSLRLAWRIRPMRRKWTPGGYRMLRIGHFLRDNPGRGTPQGAAGITGRTGTRRSARRAVPWSAAAEGGNRDQPGGAAAPNGGCETPTRAWRAMTDMRPDPDETGSDETGPDQTCD